VNETSEPVAIDGNLNFHVLLLHWTQKTFVISYVSWSV